MTLLAKARLAKQMATPLLELSDKLNANDFRTVFLTVITGIVQRVSDKYWSEIITEPPTDILGPEVKEATQQWMNALDKCRTVLNSQPHAINDIRDRLNSSQRN